ncbi:ATP-dependent RecD-like DNA helicase [Heliorestis acidaminivorans]|uniref:SF1B family DNA helicase RecD2 n=1 Tax=Heliorestis acidaminivorans TaxID=553427 RepID=UPI00147869EF|nr:ATP-dependent RecD-like DNA helicase [Heliorestis acidaminivorans]
MEQIEGKLVRTLFQEETYTVVLFKNKKSTITVVGHFLSPQIGLTYALEGEWVEHPKFGKQFRLASYKVVPPTTAKEMEKFLTSSVLKGIGRKITKKLVKAFGSDAIKILREEPDKLKDLPDLSEEDINEIMEAYHDFDYGENLFVSLTQYGLESELVYKIFRHYGRTSLAVIEDNPYSLCLDIREINFEKADRIASQLGFPHNDSKRMEGAMLFSLLLSRDEGHVFLPTSTLVNRAIEVLHSSSYYIDIAKEQDISEQLLKTIQDGKINYYCDGCYLPDLFWAEQEVVEHLYQIKANNKLWQVKVEKVIKTMEEDFGITYAPEQKEAFYALAHKGVTVITGGPGTGKTTIVKGLIALVNRATPNGKITLCAPTGRAAKRLAETTGQPAFTIHKVLGLTGREKEYSSYDIEVLEADVIIVDEVSMVDILMMATLLRSLKKGVKLVLVGDKDQLPSVGPGQVLKDIIAQSMGEIIRLQHVFRQEDTSEIVLNAHLINEGQFPDISSKKDFIFIQRSRLQASRDALIETVHRAIERAGYTLDDIQVLSPMRYTDVGVWNLNKALQELLNPLEVGQREVKAGFYNLRSGDKVMQLKNNYEKEVFNGDVGFITEILLRSDEETDEDTIIVQFDDTISYPRSEWDQLTLAYTTTVHKAQGSEYPIVIMPLTFQHRRMLRRNLLYTAVTRAREKVILIGEQEALAYAVQNNIDSTRFSAMTKRWQENVSKEE